MTPKLGTIIPGSVREFMGGEWFEIEGFRRRWEFRGMSRGYGGPGVGRWGPGVEVQARKRPAEGGRRR